MMTESHPVFAWIRHLAVPAALAACLAAVLPQGAASPAEGPSQGADPVVVELARGASRYVLDAADETEADLPVSGGATVERPSLAMIDLDGGVPDPFAR